MPYRSWARSPDCAVHSMCKPPGKSIKLACPTPMLRTTYRTLGVPVLPFPGLPGHLFVDFPHLFSAWPWTLRCLHQGVLRRYPELRQLLPSFRKGHRLDSCCLFREPFLFGLVGLYPFLVHRPNSLGLGLGHPLLLGRCFGLSGHFALVLPFGLFGLPVFFRYSLRFNLFGLVFFFTSPPPLPALSLSSL
jgi:hypothetical protein